METECLSVCTRTKFIDYRCKGSCEKDFIETLRQDPEAYGIVDLLDTTRGTVLLLNSNLFVTGIPTDRKDKVGTPIRWSFHLRKDDAASFFGPLVTAFKTGEIKQLGKELDKICGFSPENDKFSAPSLASFLSILPESKNMAAVPFKLWANYILADPDDMQALIDELSMPEGEILIYHNGEDRPYPKKKQPAGTAGHPGMAGKLILALLLVLLIVGALWYLMEESNSNDSNLLLKNGMTPPQAPIPQNQTMTPDQTMRPKQAGKLQISNPTPRTQEKEPGHAMEEMKNSRIPTGQKLDAQ